MFLPDALTGRRVAIAGPVGPLAEAVADAAGRAGAAVVLCGQDVDSLDELAWELAERRDGPVDIVAWDGVDAGDGLRTVLEDAGHGDAALVLLGGAAWTAEAAAAWAGGEAGVVITHPMEEGAPVRSASAVVLTAPDDVAEAVLAAWAVFLLTPAGRRAVGQAIALSPSR